MQTSLRKLFQNIPPPPPRVCSERNIFSSKSILHFITDADLLISEYSSNWQQTKCRFVKSICDIYEKYSEPALWLRWLCLKCQSHQSQVFMRKQLTWVEKASFSRTVLDLNSYSNRHPQQGNNWQLKFNACTKVRKQYLTNMLNPYLLALLRLLLFSSKNGISFSCIVESSQLDFWTIINAFCVLNKF